MKERSSFLVKFGKLLDVSVLSVICSFGVTSAWAADGTLTSYTTGHWEDTAQWRDGVVGEGRGCRADIASGYAAEVDEGYTFRIPDEGITLGGIKFLDGTPVITTRISGGPLTFDNADGLASAVGTGLNPNALILLAPLTGPRDVLLENCILAAPAHHTGDTVINGMVSLFGLSYAEQICAAVTNQLPPTRLFLNNGVVSAYAHSSWDAFDATFALVEGSRLATCADTVFQKGVGTPVTGDGVPVGAFFKSQLTATIFELNEPATRTGTFTLHVDGVAAGETSLQRFESIGILDGRSIMDIRDHNGSHLIWDVGRLVGTGTLRKSGPGKLAIGIDTNFTGVIELYGGTLLTRQCGDSQPDVRVLKAQGGTLEVPADTTLGMQELVLEGRLVKTGAGTLEARSVFGVDPACSLEVREGRVVLDGRCPISDSWFHVDASQADSLELVEENGTNFVTRWNDRDGGAVYATSAMRPYLVPNALAGRPVVDFGPFLFPAGGGAFAEGYGGSMDWSATDTNIREVFMVYSDCSGLNGNFFLGDSSGFDFHRGANGALFDLNNANSHVSGGLIEVDGVARAADYPLPTGFHLIHLRTTGDVRANAFARSRDLCWGGLSLAEVIVYNRKLSDDEAAQVTDYLNGKWFGSTGVYAVNDLSVVGNATLTIDADETLNVGKLSISGRVVKRGGGVLRVNAIEKTDAAELVVEEGAFGVGTNAAQSVDSVNVSAGAGLDAAAGSTLSVGNVTGASSLVKIGAGTVVIGAASTNVTAVDVREGTLAVRARAVPDGAWFHVDASHADSLELVEENGINFVTRWNDTDGGAVYATSATRPYLVPNALAGRPVVDFGSFLFPAGGGAFAEGYGGSMDWSDTDTRIREVFMVYSDCGGLSGNFLLGDTSEFDFHRGANGALFDLNNAKGALCGGVVEVDGVERTADYSLPSGFHLIHLRTTGDVRANAFGRSRQLCWGGQLFAEVIVYNRELSDAEAAQVTSYLNDKWFGGMNPSATRAFNAVSVVEGATLDLEGVDVTVDDLTCTGTITAASLAPSTLNLTSDGNSVSSFTLNGVFALPAGGRVNVSGVPLPSEPAWYVVADASDCLNRTNLASWRVVGEGLPVGRTARLAWRDGRLMLRVSPNGFNFIFR